MANSLNSMPIVVDTDLASFFAGQTLQTQRFGLRVWKIMLEAAASTSAGTVSITEPNSGAVLWFAGVPATQAAGTVIVNDNLQQLAQWRDFAVTGATATATRLYIWYRY
jgi:hypothetical protein